MGQIWKTDVAAAAAAPSTASAFTASTIDTNTSADWADVGDHKTSTFAETTLISSTINITQTSDAHFSWQALVRTYFATPRVYFKRGTTVLAASSMYYTIETNRLFSSSGIDTSLASGTYTYSLTWSGTVTIGGWTSITATGIRMVAVST